MPRQSKGPYLWFRKERKNGNTGKRVSKGHWVIIDGQKHISTGCAKREIEHAHEKIARYVAARYNPSRMHRDINDILIADVLSVYLTDKDANIGRINSLNKFWGKMKLGQINGQTCREYVKWKGNSGGSRRDLEDLRSAVNYHNKEGLHCGIIRNTLPAKGLPKDRWLTREELARLLWVCLMTKEKQNHANTQKRPLRHLAKFILIAYYTGSRSGAVLTASFKKSLGRSYVDLDRGLFYRHAQGKRATNKRQPPVPISNRLLAHMKRWKYANNDFLVQFHGKPVKSVKTAFNRACCLANIDNATPHTLRHTTATHLMQKGIDTWETAGFLGMSIEILIKTYGHHHPNYMQKAAQALS